MYPDFTPMEITTTHQSVLSYISWAQEIASTFWDDDSRQLVLDIILATQYLETRQSLPKSFKSAILIWFAEEGRTDLVKAMAEMEERYPYQDVTSDEIISMILGEYPDIHVYVFISAFHYLLTPQEIDNLSIMHDQKKRKLSIAIEAIRRKMVFYEYTVKLN